MWLTGAITMSDKLVYNGVGNRSRKGGFGKRQQAENLAAKLAIVCPLKKMMLILEEAAVV